MEISCMWHCLDIWRAHCEFNDYLCGDDVEFLPGIVSQTTFRRDDLKTGDLRHVCKHLRSRNWSNLELLFPAIDNIERCRIFDFSLLSRAASSTVEKWKFLFQFFFLLVAVIVKLLEIISFLLSLFRVSRCARFESGMNFQNSSPVDLGFALTFNWKFHSDLRQVARSQVCNFCQVSLIACQNVEASKTAETEKRNAFNFFSLEIGEFARPLEKCHTGPFREG